MSIENLRDQIDKIDDEILNLFLKRLSLCVKIGEEKKFLGLAVKDLKREEKILEKVKIAAGENSQAASRLFKIIIDICSDTQY